MQQHSSISTFSVLVYGDADEVVLCSNATSNIDVRVSLRFNGSVHDLHKSYQDKALTSVMYSFLEVNAKKLHKDKHENLSIKIC